MTLSTTANKVSYAGDGTTTSFAIPFLFLENAHIEAILRRADGVETVWVLNTEYTLTGAAAADGGTLTVDTSPTDYTPASGETLVIRRVVPETQETDYPEGGAFPATAHEQALDKLTMLVQQHSEEIARAPVLPVSSSLADITVPEPGASELIRWNAAGSALETVDALSLNLNSEIAAPVLGDRLVYNGTLWANRAGEVLNVKDYGATGDGTTDDTTAIQAAVTAAQGGSLTLIRGEVYKVTNTILVPEDTTIFGNGAEINFAISGTTKCLDVRSGCRVYDLKISLNSSAASGDTSYHTPIILGETGAGSFPVRDVVLENIEIESDRVGGNLIGLFGDVSNVRIRNVYFPANSVSYIGILLHWAGDTSLSSALAHPHNVTIDGVVCDGLNSGDATSAVVFLSTPFGVSVKNVYAKDVTGFVQVSTGTYGNSKSTVEFDDTVLYGISVSDCVINGVTTGVKIIDVSSLYSGDFQIKFDNVRLYGDDTGTGLDVQRCLNLMWQNCHIEKFVNGIRLHSNAQGVILQGGATKDIKGGGITCSATTHRHKIYGMTIEDVNQDGATNSEGACIEVQGDDWVIRDCMLGLASAEGAYRGIAIIPGSDRTLIDNVNIRDVAAGGLHLFDDGTGTVLRDVYPNDGTFTQGGAVEYLDSNMAEAWRLHKNGVNQAVTTATATKVTWTTAAVDTNSRFDNANDRVTVRRSGVYYVGAALNMRSVNDQVSVNLWVYVDGSKVALMDSNTNSGTGKNCWVSGGIVLQLSAGQYVEIFTFHDHGAGRDLDGAITDGCSFSGYKIA